MEILFSQGSTQAEIEEEAKINNRFFAEQDKCRKSYRNNKLDEALVLCKGALDLAEKLPKERALERMTTYQLLGHVYFGQKKFSDAREHYKMELEVGLDSLPPDAAELAYAYHDVALASHALGLPAETAQNYMRAEQTIILARNHIDLAELEVRYSATLKKIREHYLILLRETGQTEAAADLEKRIQAEHE
jgi:hypothetical protein